MGESPQIKGPRVSRHFPRKERAAGSLLVQPVFQGACQADHSGAGTPPEAARLFHRIHDGPPQCPSQVPAALGPVGAGEGHGLAGLGCRNVNASSRPGPQHPLPSGRDRRDGHPRDMPPLPPSHEPATRPSARRRQLRRDARIRCAPAAAAYPAAPPAPPEH